MEQKDFYQILGVDREAGQEKIKDAYRKLAFEYHPDRNKEDAAAAARMKELNEAYAVLSDPEKRRRYDGLRQAYGSSAYSEFRQAYTEQDIFRGSDIQRIFEELSRAFGLRGFDEIFRETYGPAYKSFGFRGPGASGKIWFGESRGFPVKGHLGRIIRYALKKKWGIEWPERGKDRHDRVSISPVLARTGGKMRYFYRPKSKEFLVTVPPGIRAGQSVRLRGMGDPGKGGGAPGDLYIEIRVKSGLVQKIRDFLKRILPPRA